MTRVTTGAFAGIALRKSLIVALLGLAACTTAPVLGGFGAGVTRSTTQFALARLDRLWVVSPEAQVAIQRDLGGDSEQIIGLDNVTTLEGDNFLWLQARRSGSGTAGRFDLQGLVTRIGGVPSPFTRLDNNNLRNGSDSLGPYFWQEYRSGAQTNCVIAFRRLDSGARQLPRGTNVLEVFLRNCVQGSIEEALAPIRDTRISRAPLAGGRTADVGNRALSPLAAPLQ